MAANPRLGYYAHPSDTKHAAYFDADDAAVIDPSILDADIMQSPSSAHFGRKDSFATSNGVLTPTECHAWDHPLHALPTEPASGGSTHYHEQHGGGVFMRPGPSQHQAYGPPQPHPSWPLEHGSGDCTPTTGLEFMPQHGSFDAPQFVSAHQEAPRGSFSQGHMSQGTNPFGAHADQSIMQAPQVQTPMSPHCHQDWMDLAERSRPIPKRMRPNSPSMGMGDYHRGDGIRKKNGRIDIPPERNIHTIDELIDKTTDEDVLKELKSQKRLLRNREAALASRQRKKKHTEDLEHKEKGYTNQINALEAGLADASMENQQIEEQRMMLLQRLQESQRMIESLQEDMRCLKVKHNEETSSLRSKINAYRDQTELGAYQAPAMSATTSSTGYSDLGEQFPGLNLGMQDPIHEWDLPGFPALHNDGDEYIFEDPPALSPALEKRVSTCTLVPSPNKKFSGNASEQPIGAGLLMMLLLCGAFMASKPARSQPPGMPQMPAEVRAAAPALLNNLLSEAEGTSTLAPSTQLHHVEREPHPSGVPTSVSRNNGRFEQLHERIMTPTKQQKFEQAAQLTTAQYASITNMNYDNYNDANANGNNNHKHPQPSGSRRNMADILANMQREHQQNSKAEVYTRSLLWDQIPTDVVRQFKEMVRDHDEINARHDNMFKHET